MTTAAQALSTGEIISRLARYHVCTHGTVTNGDDAPPNMADEMSLLIAELNARLPPAPTALAATEVLGILASLRDTHPRVLTEFAFHLRQQRWHSTAEQIIAAQLSQLITAIAEEKQ